MHRNIRIFNCVRARQWTKSERVGLCTLVAYTYTTTTTNPRSVNGATNIRKSTFKSQLFYAGWNTKQWGLMLRSLEVTCLFPFHRRRLILLLLLFSGQCHQLRILKLVRLTQKSDCGIIFLDHRPLILRIIHQALWDHSAAHQLSLIHISEPTRPY